MANFLQLIQMFVNGETEGASSGQKNLKIKEDVLFHYSTPILERFGDKFVMNNTRYSLVTGRLQKQITEIIDDDLLIKITKVPEGYKGSLKDFIKK